MHIKVTCLVNLSLQINMLKSGVGSFEAELLACQSRVGASCIDQAKVHDDGFYGFDLILDPNSSPIFWP